MTRPARLVLNHDNLDTSGASPPALAAADDDAASISAVWPAGEIISPMC